MKKEYDISVIIPTYNAKFDVIRRTLLSIIFQENVDFQIIITDDGSVDNHETEIKDFFESMHFDDYKLVMNRQNVGTVGNFLTGANASDAVFIKPIGQGDMLADKNVLCRIVELMNGKNLDLLASDAIYFRNVDNGVNVFSANASPQVVCSKSDRDRYFEYYVLYGDAFHGATLAYRKTECIFYLNDLLGKVKFAEDLISRFMITDGKKVCYCPFDSIFYEYGQGISTCKDEKKSRALFDDMNFAANLLEQRMDEKKRKQFRKFNELREKVYETSKLYPRIKWIMFSPRYTLFRVKAKCFPRVTSTDYSGDFLKRICDYEKNA